MTRLERLGPEAYARVRASERKCKIRRKALYPDENKLRSRRVYRERPDHFRDAQRKRRGLPEPTRTCPDRCEGCGGPPTPRRSRAGVTFHALQLDHDHTTGAFRGWLCAKRNTGMGLLGDSVEQLELRLAYL